MLKCGKTGGMVKSSYENAINECNRHIDRAIIAAVGVDISYTAYLYSGSAATTFGKKVHNFSITFFQGRLT